MSETITPTRVQITDTSFGIGDWTKVLARLHAAEADMPIVGKNAENPHKRSRYADLGGLVTAIRPVLSKNGLAFTQPWAVSGGKVRVTTMLFDVDGNMFGLDADLPLTSDRAGPQEIGALVSYGRRYGLGALVSAVTGEDDDAEGVSQVHEDRNTIENEVQNLCQAYSKLHGATGDEATRKLVHAQTGKATLREAGYEDLVKLRNELKRLITTTVGGGRRRGRGASAAGAAAAAAAGVPAPGAVPASPVAA